MNARVHPSCLLALLLVVGIAAGQSDPKKNLEKALREEFVGKFFTVRHAYRAGGIHKPEDVLQTANDDGTEGKDRVEVSDVVLEVEPLLRKEYLRVQATRVCLSVDTEREEPLRIVRGEGFVIRLIPPEPFDPDVLRAALNKVFLKIDERTQIASLPAKTAAPDKLGEARVYSVGKDGVEGPKCVSCPDPDFTDQARWAGVQGVVALWAIIDEGGRVAQAGLDQPAGCGLDEAAISAVQGWKFTPARKKGQPVPFLMHIEMKFLRF